MPAVVTFLVVAATAMVRREHADDNDTERPREGERETGETCFLFFRSHVKYHVPE
jgi:hypothetical protein